MKPILFSTLLVLVLFAAANAQHPATQSTTTSGTENAAAKYFTDVTLVNQNGEKMRCYSGLLQGKTVLITSFLATCEGRCLPMTRNLEKVQEALGDRLGKE